MGWAWLLAVAVVSAVTRRRGANSAVAIWAAPAIFLVQSLSCASVKGPAARFTLEGLAFPYPAEPARVPLLHLGTPGRGPTTTPSLALPGLPSGVAVEVLATPPTNAGGAVRPASLRLRLPEGSTATVGLALGGDASSLGEVQLSNVVSLQGGERLVVCPEGRGECAERVLAVERSPEGGFRVGPCDLSGEPRQWQRPTTWGRGEERTVALLDLYHYEAARCVPRPVDEATPFWARRDGRGGWYLPLRSFLWLKGNEARLVLLDSAETLEVRDGRPDGGDALAAEGPGPHRVVALETRVDVPFELPCQIEAEARGDLSGGGLCKRLRVGYSLSRLDLHLTRERVVIAPPSPPTVTVEATCDGRSTCGLRDVQAAYFEGAELEVGPNVPLLWFEPQPAGGEPLAAHLRFDDDARACGRTAPPCLIVGTRDGAFVHPAAGRLALGSPEGEQVFLRSNLLGLPWWLGLILVGLLMMQVALVETPASALGRLTVATTAVAAVLLAARALFAFKLFARYPHDAEGLAGTLLGVAVLPVALLLPGQAVAGLRRVALALAAALVVVLLLWRSDQLPLGGRMAVSLCLGLGGLLLFAVALGPFASRLWARLSTQRESTWWALLGSLLVLRSLLALLGFERLFDVPVIAFYWPAAILLLGLCLRRAGWEGDSGLRVPGLPRLPAPWVFLMLWLLPVVSQALFRGDTGAALVLGPPLGLALLFVWGRQAMHVGFRRRGEPGVGPMGAPSQTELLRPQTPVGFQRRGEPGAGPMGAPSRDLRVAALALLAFFIAVPYVGHRLLDRLYPGVAAERLWGVRDHQHGGQGLLCPLDDERVGSALDLAPHASVFDNGNLTVRRDDYLLRGAANRAGTRVGAEVHEFMAVLRRYAAGATDAFAGAGYLSAEVRRYGRSEVQAQLADGVTSLLVASEGGSGAILGLLALHGLLLRAFAIRHAELAPRLRGPDRMFGFVAMAAVAVPAWTTLLMVGGNFGLLPFTGQSTPLLVVFSGMDLIVAPALWVLALGATRLAEERAEEEVVGGA